MTQNTCQVCGASYESVSGHECVNATESRITPAEPAGPGAPEHAAQPPEPVADSESSSAAVPAADVPAATPYVPTGMTWGEPGSSPAEGQGGVQGVVQGGGQTDGPGESQGHAAPGMPSLPPMPPGFEDQTFVRPKRFIGSVVAWTAVSTVLTCALLAWVVPPLLVLAGLAPIAAGIGVGIAKQPKVKSIWMGVLIGILAVPVVAFGVCIALLAGASG